MFAIIGYKRPDLAHKGKVEVAFEIRQIGCFNGLNCQNAFTPRPSSCAQQVFDLVLSNVEPDGAPIINQWVYGLERRDPWQSHPMACDQFIAMRGLNDERLSIANNHGHWECIGMGYLSYEAGNQQLVYEPPYSNRATMTFTQWQHPRFNAPNSALGDARSGALLARNTVFDRYYDGYSGEDRRSYRKCTPNEQFMRELFTSIQEVAMIPAFSAAYKASRVLNAVIYNGQHHMMLIDMVGSERPSGLAVAYLQIYRNLSEKMAKSGVRAGGLSSAQLSLLHKMYHNWDFQIHDPLPLISTFVNNGSDSDIVNFTCQGFIGYAIKHSLLNCAHMVGNQQPMTVEGKYNKGYQSARIRGNFEQKVAETQSGQKFEEITGRLNQFKRYIDHNGPYCPTVESLETYIRGEMSERASLGATGIATIVQEQVNSRLVQWLTTQVSFDLKAMILQLKGVLKEGVPSFRPKPAKRSGITLAPGSMAFNDWVRQAEGQRLEPQPTEGMAADATLQELLGQPQANPETPVDRILADDLPPIAVLDADIIQYTRDAQGRFATRH